MAGGRRRKSFGGANKRAKASQKPFKTQRNKRTVKGKGKPKAKKPTAEELDKDIEQYWGDKVVAEHLDKDMDEYWEKNKESKA